MPDLLVPKEIQILVDAAHGDDRMLGSAFELADAGGARIRLSGWNHAGGDTSGLISGLPRIIDRMEAFVGGEAYRYHSKMILKEPRVGGAWEWHQDYGYWYQNGCLFPDMASCLIAIDPATRANGCLQVLKGSHRMEGIEHGRFGGQTGAVPNGSTRPNNVCNMPIAKGFRARSCSFIPTFFTALLSMPAFRRGGLLSVVTTRLPTRSITVSIILATPSCPGSLKMRFCAPESNSVVFSQKFYRSIRGQDEFGKKFAPEIDPGALAESGPPR